MADGDDDTAVAAVIVLSALTMVAAFQSRDFNFPVQNKRIFYPSFS